jgi:PAS domain S-box-containing protein
LNPAIGRPFSIKMTAIPGEGGEIGHIAVLARESSERSLFAADPSSEHFRVIAEHAADFLTRSDREGRLLYLNPAVEQLMGTRYESIVGKAVSDFNSDVENIERYEDCVRKVAQTGKTQMLEMRLPHPISGEQHYHQIRLTPEWDVNGEVVSVIGVGRDITQLKDTEERLRVRERQFRTVAENLPDLILRCDLDGRYLYVSPRLEKTTGIPARCYVGTRIGEVEASRGMSGARQRAAMLLEAFHGVVRTGELQVAQVSEIDANGTPISFEFRLVPEFDANGAMLSVLILGRDNTKEKAAEAELRILNATLEERVEARTLELERANRDLRNFASTVSHDLRAPLRVVVGYLDLLDTEESEHLSERGRTMLGRVASAARKLNLLIDAILAYSHAGQSTLSGELVDVEAIAREVVEQLVPQPSTVRVKIAKLPPAQADITMVRQILQNLIGNALKFSTGSPEPCVEVGWFRQDNEVIYYVRDNGIGFDMRYAHKIGSMFQRLHRDDEFPGSGVGLAIVKRLVERHGGYLSVDGRPGEGATFRFTLAPRHRNGNTTQETSLDRQH